jgi:hypothetical protein
MKPRWALAASIACGTAAVLLVGLDLAFNVDAHLDIKGRDGSWATVTKSGPSSPYARTPACGNDFRLVVHNGLPWSTTQVVIIQPEGQQTIAPMTQTWTLRAGETRSWEFHLNGTANPPPTVSPVRKEASFVQATVGDAIYLSGSVCGANA